MASLTYFWAGKAVPVITLDFFTCGGEELAVVQALNGKPFSSMGRWTIATPFMTVKVKDLIIEPDECDCVLPEQSCPACRAAAHHDDGIPYVDDK